MLAQGLSSFFTFFVHFMLLVFSICFVYDLVACLVYPFMCQFMPLSTAFFNSCHFLCFSIPSFGVSTMSPKKSSSFNMCPISAIIFSKCRDLYHMKNNMRYRGNTNNTSVIIFFIRSQKLPAMVLCLGEPQRRFFVMLIFISFFIFISFLYLHFIVDLHFVVVLHLLMFFIHLCFSTSSLTLPWTITRFLHPFHTLSPVHRRVICSTFIFNHSIIFLLQTLRFWVGIFYLQAFFTLCSVTNILTCVYQGLLGSQQFFLEISRALYWSLKHRPGPSVCLIYSNPQSSYSEWFTFKFYHISSWIACGESLIYLLLTRFKLSLLVQNHM